VVTRRPQAVEEVVVTRRPRVVRGGNPTPAGKPSTTQPGVCNRQHDRPPARITRSLPASVQTTRVRDLSPAFGRMVHRPLGHSSAFHCVKRTLSRCFDWWTENSPNANVATLAARRPRIPCCYRKATFELDYSSARCGLPDGHRARSTALRRRSAIAVPAAASRRPIWVPEHRHVGMDARRFPARPISSDLRQQAIDATLGTRTSRKRSFSNRAEPDPKPLKQAVYGSVGGQWRPEH